MNPRTPPRPPTVYSLLAYVGDVPRHVKVTICPHCSVLVTDRAAHDAASHAEESR